MRSWILILSIDASDKRCSGVALCGTCHYLFRYFDTVTFNVSSK